VIYKIARVKSQLEDTTYDDHAAHPTSAVLGERV